MRHLTAKAHKLSNEDAKNIADRIESQMYVLVDREFGAHRENNRDKDSGEDKDKEGNIDKEVMGFQHV
jgi:hypothetical protein